MLRPASADQPAGPRWPAISVPGLHSTQAPNLALRNLIDAWLREQRPPTPPAAAPAVAAPAAAPRRAARSPARRRR